MFDFLKDMSLASHGVDVNAVRTIRAERREQKRQGKFIFSMRAKIIICALAALYIALTIYGMTGRGSFSLDFLFDILFILAALGIVLCLWAFGKKGEVVSLCGIIGLVIGFYLRIVI